MAQAIKPKSERDWKIEHAADTLLEAEEIKANKPLHTAAMKELQKRSAAIQQVAQKRPPATPKKRKPPQRGASWSPLSL